MAQLTLLRGYRVAQRIVKRKKHTEQYQREKLEQSIVGACLSVKEYAGSAELTAKHVCDHVEDWLEDKLEVTSRDLRTAAGRYLEPYNPSAALVYVTHMEVN